MAATPVTHKEPELTAPVMLCGPDSLLNRQAIGWSRHPLHACNLPDSLPRKKKWNYWAVTSNDLLFSATIADIERLQLAGASSTGVRNATSKRPWSCRRTRLRFRRP